MSSTQTENQQFWDFIVHWRLVGIVVIVALLALRAFTVVWLRYRNAEHYDEVTREGAFFFWMVSILTLVFLIYSYRNH